MNTMETIEQFAYRNIPLLKKIVDKEYILKCQFGYGTFELVDLYHNQFNIILFQNKTPLSVHHSFQLIPKDYTFKHLTHFLKQADIIEEFDETYWKRISKIFRIHV
jgi:hypothetical protein